MDLTASRSKRHRRTNWPIQQTALNEQYVVGDGRLRPSVPPPAALDETCPPSLTVAHCGLLRRVTAVDGRNVRSTAVDRDQTCANAGDGLKNLALSTLSTVDGRSTLLTPSPAFACSHTFIRGRRHVTTIDGHIRHLLLLISQKADSLLISPSDGG